MKIISASETTFPLIESFIQPYEQNCVMLASYIRRRDTDVKIAVLADQVTSVHDIFGVVYFEKLLLHCFPTDADPQQTEDFLSLLVNLLLADHLKCISGDSAGTDLILEKLKSVCIEPYQYNHYRLMTLETSPFEPPEPLSCDDEIRRVSDADFDALFDLQKKYMEKEVAPPGKPLSDAECSISLKQILKNQLCYVLSTDGEIVSKANTNAIGINWVQLGGIYTHPLYRKNYYAWNLIRAVCLRIQKTNRKVCLFVKEKNNPAYQLYLRIGFVEKSSFTICYFE